MENITPNHEAEPVPAVASAQAFAASAEAAVADLELNVPTGMGPLEQALAARVRAACGELRECASQVAEDGLMVLGSTGQHRPHPLLKVTQELRKEIATALSDLTFRVTQLAMFVEATELTRQQKGEQ
jgi:hypothetical protein